MEASRARSVNVRFTKTKKNTKTKTNTKTIVSWCRHVLSRLVNVVEASQARSVNTLVFGFVFCFLVFGFVSCCRLVLSRLVNVVEASRARSVNVRFTR